MSISANELRIGNWLNVHVAGHFKVRQINQVSVVFEGLEGKGIYDYSILHPIPLTPEILEKAGFERQWFGRYSKGLVDIEKYRNEDGYVLLNGEERSAWNIIYIHVHQFQNLYFALTGQELDLKL